MLHPLFSLFWIALMLGCTILIAWVGTKIGLSSDLSSGMAVPFGVLMALGVFKLLFKVLLRIDGRSNREE